jgi:hypothetical protein
MALLGGRIQPLIDLRLLDAGEGDPVVTDRGFSWYDILANSYGLGKPSRNTRRVPLLEWLPGIGLSCRTFFVAQDTLLVNWTTSGGLWYQSKPGSGRYRNTRLYQQDTGATVQWSATSRSSQRQNPSFAVLLTPSDMPPDYDTTTVEPFVRVEFGSGAYRFGVKLDKDGRCYLEQFDLTVNDWQHVMDLPAPPKAAGLSDGEQLLIGVRCKRGQVGVSVDWGQTHTWYGTPGTIAIPGAPATVRGAGGAIDFLLGELREYTATWDSPRQPTLTSSILGSALVDGWYEAPPGSSLTFTDTSDTLAALAGYRATFTVNPDGQGPVLYSTTFRYLTQSVVGAATYTTPWTGAVNSGHGRATEVRIRKPESLRESTCTVRIKLNSGDTPITALRRRKLQVRLGYRVYTDPTDDTVYADHWWTAFTGYTGLPEFEQGEFGGCWMTVTATAAAHWTKTEWWPTDVRPLGGRPVNDAADVVLESEGISGLNLPLYRNWDPLGDAFILDTGTPEEPFELIRPTEDKWTTLERLFSYPELELGIDDEAVLFTLQRNPDGTPATTGVFHDYHASGADSVDLEKMLQEAKNRLDYDQSGTAVMISARSQADGTAIRVYAVDTYAEDKAAAGDDRFCPWREAGPDGQQEISDPCNAAMLIYKVGQAAYRLFPLKWEPELVAFLNLNVGRRDTIRVHGTADQALPDTTECVVMTADHLVKVELDGTSCSLDSSFGLFWTPS